MLKTATDSLAKRYYPLIRSYSAVLSPQEKLQSFRTTEVDPLNHSSNQHAQFYNVDPNDKKTLFPPSSLPKLYETQIKTFNEMALMIREPSLDIINCIKNIDLNKPTIRFVLYGPNGSGKTLTLAHLLHHAYKQGFLLVHVPWVSNWTRRCKESSASESKEGFIDTNLDAADWLTIFKTQNANLLKNPDLVLSEDVVWNKRENTPKGSHLSTLVDYGINRVKYASFCIVRLAEEIKHLSTTGVCKTLVAVDGFNAFFYPKTRVLTEKKEVVHPEKLTVTEAFKSLTRFDWKNGIAVVTVDQIVMDREDQISPLPK